MLPICKMEHMLLKFGGNTVIAICLSIIDIEDEDKFNRFYERYFKLVIFILNDILDNYHEVEDVASECFLEFAKTFHRIKDIESKETENYVKILTRHKGFKAYNKRKNIPEAVDIDSVDDMDPVNMEDAVIGQIRKDKIYNEVFLKIPDRYYEIMYLSVVMGFTPKEIGNILDISIESTYKKLRRARTIIKKILDKMEEG